MGAGHVLLTGKYSRKFKVEYVTYLTVCIIRTDIHKHSDRSHCSSLQSDRFHWRDP